MDHLPVTPALSQQPLLSLPSPPANRINLQIIYNQKRLMEKKQFRHIMTLLISTLLAGRLVLALLSWLKGKQEVHLGHSYALVMY